MASGVSTEDGESVCGGIESVLEGGGGCGNGVDEAVCSGKIERRESSGNGQCRAQCATILSALCAQTAGEARGAFFEKKSETTSGFHTLGGGVDFGRDIQFKASAYARPHLWGGPEGE